MVERNRGNKKKNGNYYVGKICDEIRNVIQELKYGKT